MEGILPGRCKICGKLLNKTDGDIGPVCKNRYDRFHARFSKKVGRDIFADEEGNISKTDTDTSRKEDGESKDGGAIH